MRICILQDYLRSGGTERQSVLLARAFAAAGHGVTVLTFRPGGVLAAGLIAGGSPAPRHEVLQGFDWRINGFAPGLARRLRALAPDVVLCMGRMANGRGARVKRVLPDAVVVGTMRTGKGLQRGFRESLRVVDHVVANSGESAAVLREVHGVPAERVSVIYNGLVFPAGGDAGEGRGVAAEALRTTHGVGREGVVLLCVGMFRPEKNQRAIIEAAARLAVNAEWQLWFGGEGPERARCEALARRLGIGERVRFFGFVENPGALYRAADVAVLASRAESLSNFLIEAQAHGLPAVAMEVAGARECMRVGVSGVVTPAFDADGGAGFTAALRSFIEDTDGRRAAGAAARVFARAAFDPARQVVAYLDLFARLRRGREGG
ncbi:glycosyltransferase [Opitutaceae bacterium TAV4]|nr:glycosyltransferase [Opitutaceae bacterium TAV4]RRJ99213.1 glycosyltransferase [Opitutaceae bacterium TAV3]